jgi:hypothetical protein
MKEGDGNIFFLLAAACYIKYVANCASKFHKFNESTGCEWRQLSHKIMCVRAGESKIN